MGDQERRGSDAHDRSGALRDVALPFKPEFVFAKSTSRLRSQNLYEIGKQVEEPSEEEVGNAISTFRASL